MDPALRTPREQSAPESPGNGAPADEAPAATAGGQPAPRKTGAPKGNVNGFRHGLRQGGRRLLIIGSTPSGHRWIDRIIDRLRSELERQVVTAKGRLSRADEETIQSACRWERHAILATTWLRKGFDTLTADQRLSFSREVAEASEKRDRKLKSLGIDSHGGGDDPWGSLESARFASDAERLTEAPDDANDAGSRDSRSQRP